MIAICYYVSTVFSCASLTTPAVFDLAARNAHFNSITIPYQRVQYDMRGAGTIAVDDPLIFRNDFER